MLRLVPLDERLLGLAGQPDALSNALGVAVGPVAGTVREVLMQSAAHSAQAGAAPGPEGFLVIEDEEKLLVGTCAFVHPPGAAGQVEIAYFTFPPYEGRGYATAMAGALLERARSSSQIRIVYAHTLPEANASCRVLARNGFLHCGTGHDDEVGEVWRWEIALHP